MNRSRSPILRLPVGPHGCAVSVLVRPVAPNPPDSGFPSFFETEAIIDTGASHSGLDDRIAHALSLPVIDQVSILTIGGILSAPIFVGVVEIPARAFRRTIDLAGPRLRRPGYGMLIGRDLLGDFTFTLEGRARMFSLAPESAAKA